MGEAAGTKPLSPAGYCVGMRWLQGPGTTSGLSNGFPSHIVRLSGAGGPGLGESGLASLGFSWLSLQDHEVTVLRVTLCSHIQSRRERGRPLPFHWPLGHMLTFQLAAGKTAMTVNSADQLRFVFWIGGCLPEQIAA